MSRYADPHPWADLPTEARAHVARSLQRIGLRAQQEATHAARRGEADRAARRATDAESYLSAAAHLGLPLSDASRRNLATMREEVGASLDAAGNAVAEVMP